MQELLKKTKAYTLLKREGETGFSHAYLLSFADGKFLREALKVFAKILLSCDEPKTERERRRAELIDSESFADCLFYPEQGKKLLVEDAEKILEESALAPVEGEKKLFALADFAEANAQTQNKLLKVLEEPPKGVAFLLGTTSTFPVLATVLSRTKKLEIFDFPADEVAAFLERSFGEKYSRESIALCAAASGGNLGEAQLLLTGGKQQGLLDEAFSLLLCPLHKLPATVKSAGETPYKKELLRLLRLLCRDALLLKEGLKAKLSLPMERARLGELAKEYEAAGLLFAQEELSKAEKQMRFNAVFPQCLEICAANIRAQNEKLRAYKG